MKNINDIIRLTYDRVKIKYPDLSVTQVEQVINFLFDEFRVKVNSFQVSGVRIKHVGLFHMVPPKINTYIRETSEQLAVLKAKQDLEGKIYTQYTTRQNELNEAMGIFTKVLTYEQVFINHRTNYLKEKYAIQNQDDLDDNDDLLASV